MKRAGLAKHDWLGALFLCGVLRGERCWGRRLMRKCAALSLAKEHSTRTIQKSAARHRRRARTLRATFFEEASFNPTKSKHRHVAQPAT
jgi:hypothetical protein